MLVVMFVIFTARCYALHSADYSVERCLSVRPSVTCRYSVEMARHILKLFSPSPHHSTLSAPNHKTIFPLTGASNAGVGYERIAIFDQYLASSQKRCKIRP